jgi:penicillin-binding protein 2
VRNQPFSQFDDDSADAAAQDPRRRPRILTGMIVAILILISVRLVHLQHFISGRFLAAWDQAIRETEVVPCRDGRIVAADGVVLAQDEVRYDIAIDYRWLQFPPDTSWLRRQALRNLSPKERRSGEAHKTAEARILAQRQSLFQSLADVADIPLTQLETRCLDVQTRVEKMLGSVERRRRERAQQRRHSSEGWPDNWQDLWQLVRDELMTPPDRFADDPIILKEELQPHVVLQDVSFETVSIVQSRPAEFPGVHVQVKNIRSYPQSRLAGHLVGVRRVIAGESEQRRGESGVERFYAAQLDGEPGSVQHVKNRRGEELEAITDRKARDGHDVMLTIDSRLQSIAEDLLDRTLDESAFQSGPVPAGACLVAMDLWTGDILTLASSPRVAPADLIQPSLEKWNSLQKDPRRPLFPRGTQMALPPGSLFKLVTAAAALEAGVVTADETISCAGFLEESERLRCPLFRQQGIGHGQVSLTSALGHNCHVYFYELSRRVPAEAICDWGRRFGFGAPTGIDLPFEASGAVPGSASAAARRFAVSPEQLAIGQGPLLVTPLQVARMMAAIANGGFLVVPRIAQTDDSQGSPRSGSHLHRIEGLSRKTLGTLQQALAAAMLDPAGEAHAGQVQMLSMSALAATATGGHSSEHTWFAGYAPAERPRVAFTMVLEAGGSTHSAGEVLRQYLTELLGLGYLSPFSPDTSQSDDTSPSGTNTAARAGNLEETLR